MEGAEMLCRIRGYLGATQAMTLAFKQKRPEFAL